MAFQQQRTRFNHHPQNNAQAHTRRSNANINDGRWTFMEKTPQRIAHIKSLCHSSDDLQQAGYVMAPLSSENLLRKLRCEHCAAPITVPDATIKSLSQKQRKHCSYHPKGVIGGAFVCCGTRVFTRGDKGCFQAPSHEPPTNFKQHLKSHWRYYCATSERVPELQQGNPSPYLSSSRDNEENRPSAPPDVRTAVALDCEFGINKYNESELIRVSAIDFFSGAILLDSLVNPNVTIKHYNTRYSGISAADMAHAKRTRTCFDSRDAARAEVLRFVGPETVIVAHGGCGDLTALRLIHPYVVDSLLLDAAFVPVEGGRSLKNLCDRRLKIRVQAGKSGHDSVEDALGARELVLWYMQHSEVGEDLADDELGQVDEDDDLPALEQRGRSSSDDEDDHDDYEY